MLLSGLLKTALWLALTLLITSCSGDEETQDLNSILSEQASLQKQQEPPQQPETPIGIEEPSSEQPTEPTPDEEIVAVESSENTQSLETTEAELTPDVELPDYSFELASEPTPNQTNNDDFEQINDIPEWMPLPDGVTPPDWQSPRIAYQPVD